jgi:hypothetical protein
MANRETRVNWHGWSVVVEADSRLDLDRLCVRVAAGIAHARTLDGLLEAVDRVGDREGLNIVLELEPRWDGVQAPNELRATFLARIPLLGPPGPEQPAAGDSPTLIGAAADSEDPELLEAFA